MELALVQHESGKERSTGSHGEAWEEPETASH
jgi:hypothetical protein